MIDDSVEEEKKDLEVVKKEKDQMEREKINIGYKDIRENF